MTGGSQDGDKDAFAAILGASKGRPLDTSAKDKEAKSAEVARERELNPFLRDGGAGIPTEKPTPTRASSDSWTRMLVQRSLEKVRKGECSLEEVARERFGDVQAFEEECRRVGIRIDGFLSKPSTESRHHSQQHRQEKRPYLTETREDAPIEEDVNKLVAKKMKAELSGNHELARSLEQQIERASKAKQTSKERVTLLPREQPRQPVSDSDDIRKMLEHERLAVPNEFDKELAGKISKNARYGDRMEDLEEMSDRFGEKPHGKTRSKDAEAVKRQVALGNYKKMQRIQEGCWFCLDSSRVDKSLIMAYGNFTYLSLPKYGQLHPLHCQIVPMEHAVSTLQCEDSVWDEIRNFKKSLLHMAAGRGLRMVFLEASMDFAGCHHCFVDAVPLPGDTKVDPRGIFKKALLDCDAEWAQHKRIIDTTGDGSGGLRKAIPKNFPYVYVDFRLDQGYAHVVEDEERVTPGFLRNLTANFLGIEGSGWRRRPTEQSDRLDFQKAFELNDWTKLLHS